MYECINHRELATVEANLLHPLACMNVGSINNSTDKANDRFFFLIFELDFGTSNDYIPFHSCIRLSQ